MGAVEGQKYAQCKKFGHVSKCCNDITRAKGRVTKMDKAKKVEEDGIQEANTIFLCHINTKKEDKKARQRAKKVMKDDEVNINVMKDDEINIKANNKDNNIVIKPKIFE